MSAEITEKVWKVTGASALLIALLSFALGSVAMGIGALVGGVFAFVDTYSIAWIAAKIKDGNVHKMSFFAVIMILKSVFMLGLVWAVITRFGVHRMGFAAGFSSLIIGLYLSAMWQRSEGTKESHEMKEI